MTTQTIGNSQESGPVFRRGEGYLFYIGHLQIIIGILSIVLSLFVMLQAWVMRSTLLLGPVEIYRTFGGSQDDWVPRLMAALISCQLMFGWILGLMMISAGICCLKNRARGWVTFVTALNLFNFPHGSTAALIIIHGLTRPGIRGAFRR